MLTLRPVLDNVKKHNQNYHLSIHMAFWKDSMINWLSNLISRNISAAKISQVLCSNIHNLSSSSMSMSIAISIIIMLAGNQFLPLNHHRQHNCHHHFQAYWKGKWTPTFISDPTSITISIIMAVITIITVVVVMIMTRAATNSSLPLRLSTTSPPSSPPVLVKSVTILDLSSLIGRPTTKVGHWWW